MKSFVLLLFTIILFADCRKVPDFGELSSDFIVSTSLDTKANFSSYKTFYIADTIVYIGGVGNESVLTDANAMKLIQAVKDNLTSRGYVYTSRNNHPDIGLTLSAIKDIDVVVDYYPGWWDSYWPGCYWYCYSYYYPWTTAYTYSTGTVILNMYDLKNAETKDQVTGIWNITALGALGANAAVNTSLGIDALEQGFAQSPYVKTN
jgi:hypothetical protein